MRNLLVCCLIAILAAACQNIPQVPRDPTVRYTTGALLTDESFDNAEGWQTWSYEGINLRFWDSTFRITADDRGYVWTINDQVHNNVVIEVQTRQLSTDRDNGYGVMCRAQDN